MRRIQLPGRAVDACVVGRTCTFLLSEPWRVAAWSLEGRELWQRSLQVGDVRPHLARFPTGEVWVSTEGRLERAEGDRIVRTNGQVEAFACLDDGVVEDFVVGLDHKPFRFERIGRDGTLIWRRRILPTGRMERGRIWSTSFVRPAVVPGERAVLVGLAERSGVGFRYVLSLADGRVVWTSEHGPLGETSRLPGGWYLGTQGYGRFSGLVVSETGKVGGNWQSSGLVARLPSGQTMIIETDNSGSHGCAAELLPDGSVRRGEQLDGFWTSEPIVTTTDELLFWRGDKLSLVGLDLIARTVADIPGGDLAAPGAMHLGDDGTIAFTLGDALWVGESDLRPSRPG